MYKRLDMVYPARWEDARDDISGFEQKRLVESNDSHARKDNALIEKTAFSTHQCPTAWHELFYLPILQKPVGRRYPSHILVFFTLLAFFLAYCAGS